MTQNGIWPKNINTADYRYDGLRSKLQGTFDNSASLNELRLLAKAYNATKNNAYKKAFNKGLECILDCQHPNGGWPQSPNAKGYSEHITFNDGTMIGIMKFLREVHKDNDYKFATEKNRRICKERFDLGIQCIIKCQIREMENSQLGALNIIKKTCWVLDPRAPLNQWRRKR